MYIYIYKSEIVYLYIPVSTHLNMTHFSHPKNASTLKGKQETVSESKVLVLFHTTPLSRHPSGFGCLRC